MNHPLVKRLGPEFSERGRPERFIGMGSSLQILVKTFSCPSPAISFTDQGLEETLTKYDALLREPHFAHILAHLQGYTIP